MSGGVFLFRALVALLTFGVLGPTVIEGRFTSGYEKRAVLNPLLKPFYHGVASGDPTSSSVILWTRVTPDSAGPVHVSWELAADTTFQTILQTGDTLTDATRDYTVKIDVQNLQPATWYYYRFSAGGNTSIVGRTRTFPASGGTRARLAIVSCSNYQRGYFNVYERIAERNDVDAVLHLGDYIYEGAGGSAEGREHHPAYEILELADYRARYSQYRMDPDLIYCHQQYPFITVWDDHESANDAWKTGAENHQPATEGPWAERLNAAAQAYQEWLPIRTQDPNRPEKIYRQIEFGDLFSLHMLDTRIIGRDEPAASVTDAAVLEDTTRTMLGQEQFDWFMQNLRSSEATWQLVGQQVMFAPLVAEIPFTGTYQILNPDQWDGYTPERQRVMDSLVTNAIDNVVVLTGDIHTSWASDIPYDRASYDPGTGAGSVAVEFVTPSITSGNELVDDDLFPFPVDENNLSPLIQAANPHIKFVDLNYHGYYVLDIDNQRAQGDWFFVSTIEEKTYEEFWAAGWFTRQGENHLQQAEFPVQPPANLPVPAPRAPANPVSLPEDAQATPVVVGLYPNPTPGPVELQFLTYKPENLRLRLVHISGRTVWQQPLGVTNSGVHVHSLNFTGVAPGHYYLQLEGQRGRKLSRRLLISR